MEINIRNATLADAEEINICLKLAFSEYEKESCYNAAKGALNEDVLKTGEDIATHIFLVAEHMGMIIGSVRVKLKNREGYLSRFSVLPEYHQYGTGKILLEEIDKIMHEKGVNSIYLHTCLDVEHLVNFYKSFGYEVESVSEDRGYKRAKLRKIYGE